MSTGMGIFLAGVLIAIVILLAASKNSWDFRKVFSGLTIAFIISAILLAVAIWYLNHTEVIVAVHGTNPLDFLRNF